MKVGVIGAGAMGSGIAQAFAQTEGYEVCLCDIKEEFAAGGKDRIAKSFAGRVAKGKMEQADADKILAKITTGLKDICKDCDLIVEAAFENLEVKKTTFKEVRDIAMRTEKGLLKSVTLFDVYEGEKLGEGKKSYAVSFLLQNEEGTLTDKQIDKIMNKLMGAYKHLLNAKIR